VFIKLLIFFVFIPVMELYILIEAGRIIGLAPTVGLIMMTGVAGAYHDDRCSRGLVGTKSGCRNPEENTGRDLAWTDASDNPY
jgi:hypothetical protein